MPQSFLILMMFMVAFLAIGIGALIYDRHISKSSKD